MKKRLSNEIKQYIVDRAKQRGGDYAAVAIDAHREYGIDVSAESCSYYARRYGNVQIGRGTYYQSAFN